MLLLPVAPLVLALVLCPKRRFAFYHVPKTGGSAISEQLQAVAPDCAWYGGILTATEAVEWLGVRVAPVPHHLRVDPMHTMPSQLEEYVRHARLRLFNRSSSELPLPPVDEIHTRWISAAMTRSPYMRVLSAHDSPGHEQRLKYRVYSEAWGSAAPTKFAPFMRWLHEEVRSMRLSWCCDPVLTHFLPAARYTHWPSGRRAVTHFLKYEGGMSAAQRAILGLMGGPGTNLSYVEGANLVKGGAERQTLCAHMHGCDASELSALLRDTKHTMETLAIVEELYHEDFQWHNYSRLLNSTLRKAHLQMSEHKTAGRQQIAAPRGDEVQTRPPSTPASDCRGCTHLIDVRCPFNRANMFGHRIVDCLLPVYAHVVKAIEEATEASSSAEQQQALPCLLGEVDVTYPFLSVLLPAAGIKMRLVGSGSAAAPLDLSTAAGCDKLEVPPIQRVLPHTFRDYVCPGGRSGEELTLPGGARCRSSSGEGPALLRGIHAHLRALAAAAAASVPARKTIVLISRSPKLWSALHNSRVHRGWTEDTRKALLGTLDAVPGASVEELDGTEDMATQLRVFQRAAAIVGVHGAGMTLGMTNAPFATRPVCVVELGAWLNMKNGQGQFEWRSSGMIAHWSPDTMHWILYRLPPQDILPRESHKGFFALPSSAGSDSKASGMTRDQYLLDVPRVQVPAKHLAHIARLVAGSWAWRGEPRNVSGAFLQMDVIECRPVACHVKHGHQPIWFHG